MNGLLGSQKKEKNPQKNKKQKGKPQWQIMLKRVMLGIINKHILQNFV